MTAYCDTSLLIAALADEEASARVHAWLETRSARDLFVSDWTIAEFASAVSVKFRNRQITVDQRAAMLAAWASLRKTSLTILPVLSTDFLTAATYAEQSDLGLRAGDALHLAIAAANGHSIATLDGVQGRASVELGIPREAV